MLIKSLHLKNILSFRDTKLDLQPLNVLIGANGSGKSNLIDVIALLQAVPGDLPSFFRRHGPISNWVWKGEQPSPSEEVGFPHVEAILSDYQHLRESLRYEMGFAVFSSGDQYNIHSEKLEILSEPPNPPRTVIEWDRVFGIIANVAYSESAESYQTPLSSNLVRQGRSVLAEFRDPLNHPVTTNIAAQMAAIKSYRSWYVGRDSPVRHPQRTDGDPNFLEEDFSNLALVVNDLLSRRLEPSLNDYLNRFYESYESLHSRIFGNTIELVVNETGMGDALSASRLSDGTIRFIALLAILCHPEPPPLICIEEPEIAMHPDSLGLIAELLRKAAERTQIIVTTHSPELVSLLPPEPEAEFVVVCERDAAEGSHFHRPSYKKLREWQDIYQQTGKELVVYGLSEMWMSGSIGGVR